MTFLHGKIEKYVLIEFGSNDFIPTVDEMHKSIDREKLEPQTNRKVEKYQQQYSFECVSKLARE